MSCSYFEMEYIAQRIRTTEAFGCSYNASYNVSFNGMPLHPLHLRGAQVSPGLMRSLGMQPTLGRWFSESAQEASGARGVVLSRALWQRLGGDPQILGKSLNVRGGAYTAGGAFIVTGVMPPAFRYPIRESVDFWVPIIPRNDQIGRRDASNYLICVAKRKAGVPLRQMTDDF